MHKPANDKPNVLPADVTKLLREFHQHVTTAKPDVRVGEGRPLARDIRAKAK
jgi:hypothetical protein